MNATIKPNAVRFCLRKGAIGWGALALFLISCSDPGGSPTVGSNSNWLRTCSTDDDCSKGHACLCRICTERCSTDDDCTSASGTRCESRAAEATQSICSGTTPTSGLCLVPCELGGCATKEACVLGACVPHALPTSNFCSIARDAAEIQRVKLDELFDVVEGLRQSGGIACNGSTSGPLSLLRVEPRLSCAAQVLVADIASTGNGSLTDSSNRSTTDRLTAVGYTAANWVEGFAVDADSPTAALQTMLSTPDFCAPFINSAVTELGVGLSSRSYVITLASE